MRFFRCMMVMALLAVFYAFPAQAQVPAGYRVVDSLVYVPLERIDTTAFSDWREAMPSNVKVSEPQRVRDAMMERISNNESRTMRGYRIRIYFDNKQESRSASEAAELSFRARFPWMPSYRTFQNPYFKVTVGNFRTKSEALSSLGPIKEVFPSAFIVREKFRYPELSGVAAYRVDTLHLIRPVPQLSE